MPDEPFLRAWFCREVLPLEPILTRFIKRHWRVTDEIADIRQDIYERILTGAARQIPTQVGPYAFTVARNVILNRARRAKIVSIDQITDLDSLTSYVDWLTPDRRVDGRAQLRRVQEGLDRLPPRCREVIYLRKIEGLSTKEAAGQLGVSVKAVEQQTTFGIRALADFLLGGDGHIERRRAKRTAKTSKGVADE